MKIILVMVESLDGKTTKGNNPNPSVWNSKEDQSHFGQTIKKAKLIIMGSGTYIAIRKVLKLSPKIKRIVLTRNPKEFAKEQVEGQLEFTDTKPTTLLQKLEGKGYKEGFLVGGETINNIFFQQKLVNEILLTLEPVLLGQGKGLAGEENLNIKLQLKSKKQLNKAGTLLLKYHVNYEN